jgi:hypothetical protein
MPWQVYCQCASLAIIESQCMTACACGSENCLHCGQAMLLSSDSDCRKLKDAFLQPVHIVNELVTPEVDYDSWKEFVELVYLVQDVFCNLLAEAVQQEFQTDHMSPVLTTTSCSLTHMNRSEVPLATRMQFLGSLNTCQITHSCTNTSDV